MFPQLTRRDALKTAAVGALVASMPPGDAVGRTSDGSVRGHMTGARALVETLIAEGTSCVFGIPGAQENELWDEMKSRNLPYLLVTHENSAACMADGVARSTGRPGVLCVVPGPGLTNSLTGIGEALLDSVPLVCIVGDVARGDKYRPFQVHELPQAGLLQQVCKCVIEVKTAGEIPGAVRQAFRVALQGEPGPTAVVVPYNLLIDAAHIDSAPLGPLEVPFDEAAFLRAAALLADRKVRVGIYAGMGCMDSAADLLRLADVLQAPVATSVSGKGVIDECHPLAVGWGFGPQGTRTAENAFKNVDLVLAIGVRFSEVSTAFYSLPQPRCLIHVDANCHNLGRILKTNVCVHADAGVFLSRLLADADTIRRPFDAALMGRIKGWKVDEAKTNAVRYARCGADPMQFYLSLRCATNEDALVFVDVSVSEHWAAEAFAVRRPRTYFNPTDNQSMGWSIPASLGAQRVHMGRQVVAVTGDGCFLMSGMELSTAARECLPVKFFILDDQAYHYMQALQIPAYRRTTATILARLDYAALAKGFGLAYQQIDSDRELDGGIRAALQYNGPVLTRVITDYGKRPIRWIEAAKVRYTKELTTEQKTRFAARLGSRRWTCIHAMIDAFGDPRWRISIKRARYLIRRDARAFFRWLLPSLEGAWSFRDFVDASTVAFPGEPDRVCDTVAEFERIGDPRQRLLVDVEAQAEPHRDMLERLGEYTYRLRRELRFGRSRRSRYHILPVLLNLTGAPQRDELDQRVAEADGAGARLTVVLRTFRELDAVALLAQVERGEVSRHLLPWLSLMRGADDVGIIREWKRLAGQEADDRWRSDLGSLALIFASLAGRSDIWQSELRKWNMKESSVVLQWQKEAAIEATQRSLLRFLRGRFHEIPTELEDAINKTKSLAKLERWTETAGSAATLDAFRATIRL